jgi:hypothetical protein
MQPLMVLQRIVSGGQTGADRAALGFAIAHGIEHAMDFFEQFLGSERPCSEFE